MSESRYLNNVPSLDTVGKYLDSDSIPPPELVHTVGAM